MASSIIRASLLVVAIGGAVSPLSARAEYPLRELKRLRAVTYVERGEEKLLADIYMPPGDGPYPGVLMVHGGAWRVGSKWNMLHHANDLAQHGYTAVAINYRLAPKHKFPAQIDDCKEAVRWMRRNAKKYKIDPKRIGAYGYSAGAHLSALLGVTDANDGLEGDGHDKKVDTRVQAVVAGGAPCEFTWLPEDSRALEYFLGGSRKSAPEVYLTASATTFVTRDDPPFFFWHGDTDQLVPRSSPTKLLELLKTKGVPAEMHVAEKRGHILAFSDHDSRRLAREFLDKVLKKNTAKQAE